MKHIMAFALLAISLSSVVSISDARSQTRRHRNKGFVVGIFRPDGVVVPFARYTNRKWSNPWHKRQPGQQRIEPETIADLPRPWYRFFVKPGSKLQLILSTGRATTVRTSKNVQVCSHCQQVWGLATNYPNPKQPEKNECVRNGGIALNKNKRILPIVPLTDRSPDWQRMSRFVGLKFDRAETDGLGHTVPGFVAQLPPRQARAKVQLSILKLYRVRIAGERRTVFYFEASKEYPKPPEAHDAGCNNISLFSGWVSRDSRGRLVLLDSLYSPTDCDMKEGGFSLPFAILKLDGKTFAIVEEDSYEGESYVVLEIKRRRIRRVLETYAGSC